MEYTPTAFLLSGKPLLFPGTKEQQQDRGKHGHKKAPQQPRRLKGEGGMLKCLTGCQEHRRHPNANKEL